MNEKMAPHPARVLIVDDDQDFALAAADLVRRRKMVARVASSVDEAIRAVREDQFDLYLLDVMLPDGDAFDVMGELEIEQHEAVALVTGSPSIATAAKAVATPVLDYLLKPLLPQRLELLLDRADQIALTRRRQAPSDWSLIGQAPSIAGLRRLVERIAPSDLSVLVTGQTGTGKELVARELHARSGRPGSLVTLNCGAIPADLLASQLFGHERGSFTGAHSRHAGLLERAARGTLFLDEITEMPAPLQVYLLRVLETRRFERVGGSAELEADFRVVAATNREPLAAIAAGLLREDLYYRLADVTVHVPALSERSEDILLLAQHFLDVLNAQFGTERRFDARSLPATSRAAWPGNVRQLRSAVRRAYFLGEGDVHLSVQPHPEAAGSAAQEGGLDVRVGMTWSEVEGRLLRETLAACGGDKTAAAKMLGISIRTVHNRLARSKEGG